MTMDEQKRAGGYIHVYGGAIVGDTLDQTV
jgi:hypothetical protein